MEAIYVMAGIYFAIGGVCLLLALWSRNPAHLGTAVGKLDESKRVMRRRYRYSEKKYPATTSTYLYEVNGKVYKLKRSGFFARSSLMRRVTVVYLKGFPRFGYLEKYPAGQFTMVGVFTLICGIMILLAPYW